MASKKAPQKKKTSKSKKKKRVGYDFRKAFGGLFLLILLVAIAGFIIRHIILQKYYSIQPATEYVYQKHETYDLDQYPDFEIFPSKRIPHYRPEHKPQVPDKLPKVAIIIDDIGYDKTIAKNFIDLDIPLTFSVLPYSPFGKKIIYESQTKNIEIMLHLPMEPIEYPKINPGKGALLTSMNPDQLIRQLKENIAQIPFVKGVNNHMGSRITSDSNQMNQIFSVLKQKRLFFIDSRTTAETLGFQSARLFQVPFAQRDVFLDNIQEPKAVRKQIYTLIYYAKRQRQAIGICHPYNVTYTVIRKMIPEIKKKVRFVIASNVVHIEKF